MLEVGCQHGPGGAGDPGLTVEETRAHFGAWCIVSSPLILSHDLRNATIMDAVWPVIANKEALAVNQAWDGFSGSVFMAAQEQVFFKGSAGAVPAWQFWNKPVGGGKVAVLLMNHAATTATLSLPLAQVPNIAGSSWMVRDVWARKDIGVQSGTYNVTLNSHDAAFIMLTPQ
jgi:alpha-galactosidase